MTTITTRRASVLAATTLALLVSSQAQASLVTIDFNAYSGTVNTDLVLMTEDGFSIAPTTGAEPRIQNLFPIAPFSGNYIVADSTGNLPSIAAVTELDASTSFQFLGLDGGTSGPSGLTDLVDIIVEGYLGGTSGTLVGTDVFPQSTGTANGIFATFDAVNLLGKSVDTVLIKMNYNSSDDLYAFVDNIRLDTAAAAVPEPATALLLLAGLAGTSRLRRSRSAT